MKKISWPLLFLTLFLSGCTDQRETSSLSIVSGAAVDPGQSGFLVTHELVGLQEEGTVTPRRIASQGSSLLAASRAAQAQTGRSFYYGHAHSLIIDQTLAENGVTFLADFISRQKDIGLSLRPLISRAETAADILSAEPSTEDLTSFELSKLEESQSPGAAVIDIPFYKFQSDLMEEGIDPVLPAVNVMKNADDQPISYFEGTAILHGDRLRGFLNTEQTRILLLLRNSSQEGLLETASQETAFTLFHSKCRIEPKWENGNPSALVHLSVQVRLEEDRLGSSAQREDPAKTCSEALTRQIRDLMALLQQEYGSDSVGFGQAFSRHLPKVWQSIGADWETLYPSLPIEVKVDCTLRGTGRTFPKEVS